MPITTIVPRQAPSQAEVREWATENNIDVNQRGSIRRDVMEAYQRAQDGAELAARIENPAVFAAADDLAEAEFARRAQTYTPTPIKAPTVAVLETQPEPVSRPFAAWIAMREALVDQIASSINADDDQLRSVAERLLAAGWERAA